MGSFMSNSMSRMMTIMTVLVLITSQEIKKGKIGVNDKMSSGKIDISQYENGEIISFRFKVTNKIQSPTYIHLDYKYIFGYDISYYYSRQPQSETMIDLDAMWDFREQYINIKKDFNDQIFFVVETYDEFRGNGERADQIEFQIRIDSDSDYECAQCLNGGHQSQNCVCEKCKQGFSGKICSRKIIDVESKQLDIELGPYQQVYLRIPPNKLSLNMIVNQGFVQVYIQFESFEDQVANYYNVFSDTSGRLQLTQFEEQGITADLVSKQKPILITFANKLKTVATVTAKQIKQKVQQQGMNILAIILGIVAGIIFVGMIITAYCIAKLNREQSGRVNPEFILYTPSKELTDIQIQMYLPSFTLSGILSKSGSETSIAQLEKAEELDLDCVICLEQISPEDTVRIGYCRHIFHSTCLIGWLKKQRNCPYCRRQYDKPTIMGDYEQLCNQNKNQSLTDIQLVSAIYRSKGNSCLASDTKISIENIE